MYPDNLKLKSLEQTNLTSHQQEPEEDHHQDHIEQSQQHKQEVDIVSQELQPLQSMISLQKRSVTLNQRQRNTDVKLQFEQTQIFKPEAFEDEEDRYSWAISKWKLNKGAQPDKPALLNNGQYLYFETNQLHLIYNIKSGEVIWQQDDYIKSESFEVKRIIFKGEGGRQQFNKELFVFGLSEKSRSHCLYKGTLDQNDDQLLNKQNLVWSIHETTGLTFNKMYYNKQMNQFIFTTDHSFHVGFENNLKQPVRGKGKKNFKTFDNWNNPKITKNSFLHDNLYVLAANEGEDLFALEYVEKSGKLVKKDLKDYQTANRKVMDILKIPQGDSTVVLGAPLNNQPFIQVNLIQEKDVTTAYVAEFMSFVDFNASQIDPSMGFMENSSLCLLVSRDNEVIMKFLKFNSFEDENQFEIINVKQTMTKKGATPFPTGQILRACMLIGQTKNSESHHDTVLVLQFRNQIVFKSVTTKFHMSFDKSQMVSVPMIYDDAKMEVYFMTKDSTNLKIQKASLDYKKILENPVVTLYTFKSDNILLFSYHQGKFYVMEESKSIREIGKESSDTNEFTHLQTLEIGQQKKQGFVVTKYESAIITDKALYKNDSYYVLISAQEARKPQLFTQQEIFRSDKNNLVICQGPIKMEGTKSIMYVVKNCEEFTYAGLDEQEAKFRVQKEGQLLRKISKKLTSKSSSKQDAIRKSRTSAQNLDSLKNELADRENEPLRRKSYELMQFEFPMEEIKEEDSLKKTPLLTKQHTEHSIIQENVLDKSKNKSFFEEKIEQENIPTIKSRKQSQMSKYQSGKSLLSDMKNTPQKEFIVERVDESKEKSKYDIQTVGMSTGSLSICDENASFHVNQTSPKRILVNIPSNVIGRVGNQMEEIKESEGQLLSSVHKIGRESNSRLIEMKDGMLSARTQREQDDQPYDAEEIAFFPERTNLKKHMSTHQSQNQKQPSMRELLSVKSKMKSEYNNSRKPSDAQSRQSKSKQSDKSRKQSYYQQKITEMSKHQSGIQKSDQSRRESVHQQQLTVQSRRQSVYQQTQQSKKQSEYKSLRQSVNSQAHDLNEIRLNIQQELDHHPTKTEGRDDQLLTDPKLTQIEQQEDREKALEEEILEIQSMDMEVVEDPQADGESNTRAEVLFVPYLDDNESVIMYNNKNNKTSLSDTSRYPNTEMSTFIGEQENILAQVGTKFMIFSQLGKLLQAVQFYGEDKQVMDFDMDKYKLVYISDNQEYYLFHEIGTKILIVFQLKKNILTDKYRFTYKKEVKVMKKKWDSVKVHYFNEITIDNDGNVFQVQLTDRDDQDHSYSCIKIFQDSTQILDDIEKKFSLVKLNNDQGLANGKLKYSLCGNYLFIILKYKVQYYKIFENQDMQEEDQATMLQLNLSDATILRILSTQKPVDMDKSEKVQIVFRNDKQKDSIFIMTWDLELNQEYSLVQIGVAGILNPEHMICKGVKQKYNYLVTNQHFYDFQYSIPFTYLKASDDFKIISKSINERKVSSSKLICLGLGYKGSIFNSYTLLDLFYGRKLDKIDPRSWTSSILKLDHLEPNFDGNNYFHHYALNNRALEIIFSTIKKLTPDDDDAGKRNIFLNLFFNCLQMNSHFDTPFDLAVKNNSPKSIEVFLNMLIQLPRYRLSIFVKKHFNYLFAQELETFEEFLETCFFQHSNMLEPRSMNWNFEEEEVYRDYHTSYLNEEFDEKLMDQNQLKEIKRMESLLRRDSLKKGEQLDDEESKRRAKSVIENMILQQLVNQAKAELNEIDAFLDSSGANVIGKQRVELNALEFDWIFAEEGADFINTLAKTPNDRLFALTVVRVVILFLWQEFYWRIRNYIFIPYIIYAFLFSIYVTHIYEVHVENANPKFANRLDHAFIVLMILFTSYFIYIEIRQILKKQREYFTAFLNLLDNMVLILNVTYLALDIKGTRKEAVRPLGGICIIFMWIKLFFFLRLFKATASLVRMTVQIVVDMKVFTVFFAIAIFAFGNSFYILSLISYDYDACQTDPTIAFCNSFTRNNFLYALIFAFRTGLGDFQPDGFQNQESQWLIWVIFIMAIFIIQVILLNMIIALMADTFNRVTEISEQSKLKEICSLMADNEFLLNRREVFKNSKYIIYAKLEKAEGLAQQEGIVGSIKASFAAVSEELKRTTKSTVESVRDDLITSNANIEARIAENQGVVINLNADAAKINRDFGVLQELSENTKEEVLTQLSNLQNQFIERQQEWRAASQQAQNRRVQPPDE